jgi:hypothetical protein
MGNDSVDITLKDSKTGEIIEEYKNVPYYEAKPWKYIQKQYEYKKYLKNGLQFLNEHPNYFNKT